MTRDLDTEGAVPGQERIDTCIYKGGTWGTEAKPE